MAEGASDADSHFQVRNVVLPRCAPCALRGPSRWSEGRVVVVGVGGGCANAAT